MLLEERKKKFLLLQINDALFPIGAYSHSYGLETYIQKDLIKNAEEAKKFIHRRLLTGFCYNEFLMVKLAYCYAKMSNLKKLEELEELVEASRPPREVREASKKLGSRLVKTVREFDISYENNIFNQYIAARKNKSMVHAHVYGIFCAAVGIDFEECLEHYLYAQASSMVTNCVKTIPLSQTSGQKLLYACQEVFHEIMKKLESLSEDDLCLSTPGFDLRCMQHESLYSRIYMS